MPITQAQPFNAFAEGRQLRQQEDYGNTRNALANLELQQAPEQARTRNALAQQQVQAGQQELDANQAKYAYTQLAQALQSGNPKAFVLQNIPELAKNLQSHGVDFASLDDQAANQMVDGLARKYAGSAGIAPAAPDPRLQLERDKMAQGQAQADARLKLDRDKFDYERRKPQTPADTGPLVQVAGPDGNPMFATREQAVGKPAYVARDKPAAADVKWQREIKSKQPRLLAAERRVDRLAQAVENIGKNTLFDGGPLDQYALAWTKQGQEVAQAKASLTSELTALTRVPGIGSQSDLETRLATLPFPSSEFAPEVNARATAELKAFMADLKDVYGSAAADIQSSEVESLIDKYAPQK